MSTNPAQTIRGRGAAENPPNRFLPFARVPLPDYDPTEDPAPQTQFFHDNTKSILARNDSPDIPFTFSLNPYRGCEHGCVYCYARPTHEYLGFSAGLDFETRIVVKSDAPELLRKQFLSRAWVPQPVGVGSATDAYQPAERQLRITRRCLEVFAEFRNPVGVVTKNALIARDADVLGDLARHDAACAFLSITTLDADLARKMEPRASAPAARLRAVGELRKAGVPVGVMVAPVIPGLTDHEAPAILRAAADAGAIAAYYVVLRLPLGVKDMFADWLTRHYPDRVDKVLGRIRDVRGGQLNDPRFGSRMRGEGLWADTFNRLFRVTRQKAGLSDAMPALSAAGFRRPGQQLTLF
ncbi:MAG: repair photolyase [Gemmataceae bacterium]|nr:repair photolyase [Gemmataceae bacterium]